MRSNLAEDLRGAQETTEERGARLYDERRARKAMRRTVKALCMWLGGAMFIASMLASGVGMDREALFSGAIAVAATLYGGIGWIKIIWW